MRYGFQSFFAAGLLVTAHSADARQAQPDLLPGYTPHMEKNMCVLERNKGKDDIMIPMLPDVAQDRQGHFVMLVPNKVAIFGRLSNGGVIFVGPDPDDNITMSIPGVAGCGYFDNPYAAGSLTDLARRARVKCWGYFNSYVLKR